jgi:hypothetical protein
MPLMRADSGVPVAEIDAIYFPMEDMKTGEQISCRVSYAYLQDRVRLREGILTGPTMLPHFEVLRDEIEKIASNHYDDGERNPFVTTDDL